VDDALSGGDSTVSSISATSLSSVCKHRDGPRCFSKLKVRFYVPGCFGKEMRSLQTDIPYVVNTENLVRKAIRLKDKCFILHIMVMET